MRIRAVLLAMVVVAVLLVPTAAVADGEGLVALPHSFDTPVLVAAPAGDDRIFVVELEGRIRVVDDGEVTTFADLRSLVSTGGERGLLGLAFSPDFATDGRLWVNYTDNDGDTRVDRLEVNAEGTAVDPSSRTNVIKVAQPFSNHNGGMIAFADDGMLLIGLGDGGGSGDPQENGQDITSEPGDPAGLLGSILRLDVKDRAGDSYDIPSDNPFVGRTGDDEIWAYGLRNPYRFSVDRATGDVWIGDVGQSTREEVDHLAYDPDAGYNLGWNEWEGTHCFDDPCGSKSGFTFPVHEYGHGDDGRCSITGGYVVRTPGAAALAGTYLFSDFCGGGVRVYDPETGGVRLLRGGDVGSVYSFGEDGHGNVYVTTSSRVYRVVDSGTRFRDVGAEDIFADDIVALAEAGVTRGCNPPDNDLFCPADPVTREQMAAFITRAAEYERQDDPFRDVSDSNVFAGDIGAIAANDVTRGCNPPDNDLFCPGDVVTRAQMAAFLVRARGLERQPEDFVDVAADDTFAGDIGALAAADITRGCNPPDNDRFCPDDPVTREQMAAFLVRAFDL